MHRPERLRSFFLRLLGLLIASYAVWHLIEPYVVESLWMASDAAWPGLFRGGLASVEPREQHWLIRTGWQVVDAPGERATTMVALVFVRRMVSGFPLLLALLLAVLVKTHGRRVRPLLIGLAAWWIVSWAAVTGYAWHLLAVMSTGRASYIDPNLVPPPFKLAGVHFPVWEYYLSGYAMYLSLLIVPMAAPVVIWAMVCWRDLRRMVIRLQLRHRRSKSQSVAASRPS